MYPLESIVVPRVPKGYKSSLPAPAWNSIRRKKDQINLPDETAREVIQSYYASITFADAQAGRILDALDETGLTENTIVVFTSDHGYHMGEHGHWQKTTLFENSTRVPFVIAGPGVKAKGEASDAAVEMVDFFPTLAGLAGLEAPGYVSGKSLVPILEDSSKSVREVAFSQYSNGYSIRGSRYRYTEWGEKGEQGAELYDRKSDPEELENLVDSKDHATIRKELAAQLHLRIQEAQVAPEGLDRFEPSKRPGLSTKEFAPK